MSEPAMDLSEIIEPYKADARKAIAAMGQAMGSWQEIAQGGPARTELRRLSHQLRGSGRTYGFHAVSCICKAMEKTVLKLESGRLRADERVRQSFTAKVGRLSALFSGG